MKGKIVSYRRGRHLIHPNKAIIKIGGFEEKSKTQALMGKTVHYATKGGKVIKGKIVRAHGNKGLVRAKFTKGLPGQAIGAEVLIDEKPKIEKKKKAPVKKEPTKKTVPKKSSAKKKPTTTKKTSEKKVPNKKSAPKKPTTQKKTSEK